MSNTTATDSMLAVLASNVRRELDARGWTQTKLATECEWPPARISELLAGKFDPRLGTIETIAAAFSVPLSSLLSPSMPAPIEPKEEISGNLSELGL